MVDQIPANVVPEALLAGGDGTTAEDRAWLEADLSDIADLEPYEWARADRHRATPSATCPASASW